MCVLAEFSILLRAILMAILDECGLGVIHCAVFKAYDNLYYKRERLMFIVHFLSMQKLSVRTTVIVRSFSIDCSRT